MSARTDQLFRWRLGLRGRVLTAFAHDHEVVADGALAQIRVREKRLWRTSHRVVAFKESLRLEFLEVERLTVPAYSLHFWPKPSWTYLRAWAVLTDGERVFLGQLVVPTHGGADVRREQMQQILNLGNAIGVPVVPDPGAPNA